MSAKMIYNEAAHQARQVIEAPYGGRFPYFTDAAFWTKLAGDAGSSVAMSATETGGVLLLTSGATDNNEVAIYGTNELFKFQASDTMQMFFRLQFTELTGSGANIAFGMCDLNSFANMLIDDGAGPSASITSGVMLYKVDGGTVWKTWAKNNSVTKTYDSTIVPGGAAYHDYQIGMNVTDGGIVENDIVFSMDALRLVDEPRSLPIQARLKYASAAVMRPFVYAKAGAGESLVVKVKIAYAAQHDG